MISWRERLELESLGFLERWVAELVGLQVGVGAKQMDIIERVNEEGKLAGLGHEAVSRVSKRASAIAGSNGRSRLGSASRLLLLRLASKSSHPRCTLCGFSFSEAAKEAYVRDGSAPHAVPMPATVDRYRLRTKASHCEIQIDHIEPFARGGADEVDNLRLICGLCNSVKGSREFWFDGQSDGLSDGIPQVPRPYWAVKMLDGATCSEPSCTAQASDGKLLIEPIDPAAPPVPLNLRVVCDLHDNLKGRWVPATST